MAASIYSGRFLSSPRIPKSLSSYMSKSATSYNVARWNTWDHRNIELFFIILIRSILGHFALLAISSTFECEFMKQMKAAYGNTVWDMTAIITVLGTSWDQYIYSMIYQLVLCIFTLNLVGPKQLRRLYIEYDDKAMISMHTVRLHECQWT